MVNKTFIEAEECYGFCVSVHACAGKRVFVYVCMHVCVRGRECVHVSVSVCVCVCARVSDFGPPAVTPRSAPFYLQTKGWLFPPEFNHGLLQHRRPFAAELTKYFPSCSKFVSINSFVFWGFRSPLAHCL